MSGGNARVSYKVSQDMAKLYNRYNKLPKYWQGYVDAVFDRFNEEGKEVEKR